MITILSPHRYWFQEPRAKKRRAVVIESEDEEHAEDPEEFEPEQILRRRRRRQPPLHEDQETTRSSESGGRDNEFSGQDIPFERVPKQRKRRRIIQEDEENSTSTALQQPRLVSHHQTIPSSSEYRRPRYGLASFGNHLHHGHPFPTSSNVALGLNAPQAQSTVRPRFVDTAESIAPASRRPFTG